MATGHNKTSPQDPKTCPKILLQHLSVLILSREFGNMSLRGVKEIIFLYSLPAPANFCVEASRLSGAKAVAFQVFGDQGDLVQQGSSQEFRVSGCV